MPRGGVPQWDVGSEWIGVGGVYPGTGDSIGLAGTSPERVMGGLYYDGGDVGDPPFDTMAEADFEGSIGARADGGGYPAPAPRSGDEEDSTNIFVGLLAAAALTGAIYYGHYKINLGGKGTAGIKADAGGIVLIAFAAYTVLPLIKSTVTFAADRTGWGWLMGLEQYGSAS